MLKEKMGARSVRLALGLLSGLVASTSFAQDKPIQRVEITGSAIKRINSEGALPVQTLSSEAIAKTGATNAAELMQSLPAMQGFSVTATAAGTDSGGFASASIHDIGEEYTLVLLNGRRLAPTGSGSAVNLQSIPLSAVERVEILTDGASALYGSDAIAGVVNFILKRNQQGGDIEANYTQPNDGRPGRSKYVSATYGWGDLDTQGWNILASFRHDEQDQIKSTDRDFAKTGYLPFKANGNSYIYDRTSTSAIPANVTATFNSASGLPSVGFSPYLKQYGSCPERNFISANNNANAQNCGFDSVSTIEIAPENKRDSVFLKGSLKLNDSWTLTSDLAYSRFDLTARIAPNTAPFSIPVGSANYNTYVAPYLTPEQRANVRTVNGSYRTFDWGTRDSQTITESKHFVAGLDGTIGAWNVSGALTWSENSIDERYVGGYVKDKEFRSMLTNGSFNPFAPIGAQSEATKQLIRDSIYHGSVREASTTLKAAEARGSREIWTLPAGPVLLGLGADFRQYAYEQTPSADAVAGVLYNFDADPAYDMKRDNAGAFAEVIVPVTKQIEITGALRHDRISAIDNDLTGKKIGEDQSKTTYKISARYQPTQALLFRGSYGTGFKAPSMLDIAQPPVSAGFTASSWDCPIAHPDYCRPGKTQYNVIDSGNDKLRPETSKQFTIGARYEPSSRFGVGLDLWDVKIRDAVSSVSEQQAWANPAAFRDLFTTYTESSTGATYWAFRESSVNIGKSHYRGLDWDLTARHRFGFGNLTVGVNGTHMLKADYTKPGTNNDWTNSLNYFGINNKVTFKNIARLTATLDTGKLSNSVIVNYRDGYTDAAATVRNVGTGKNESIRLEVPSFTTVDYQLKYKLTEAITLRGGVKNLFDRQPPLSLRASSGHQVGFDPRYADPLGRTTYVTANYKF